MSDTSRYSPPAYGDPAAPRLPAVWAWIAGVAILCMAMVGLYRGITGVAPAAARLPGLTTTAAVDATSAAPLPHDDQWSTLSGPKVLPPVTTRPVKPAQSDDDQNDSSEPDDQSAAADAADVAPENDPATPTAPVPTPPAPTSPSPSPDTP